MYISSLQNNPVFSFVVAAAAEIISGVVEAPSPRRRYISALPINLRIGRLQFAERAPRPERQAIPDSEPVLTGHEIDFHVLSLHPPGTSRTVETKREPIH